MRMFLAILVYYLLSATSFAEVCNGEKIGRRNGGDILDAIAFTEKNETQDAISLLEEVLDRRRINCAERRAALISLAAAQSKASDYQGARKSNLELLEIDGLQAEERRQLLKTVFALSVIARNLDYVFLDFQNWENAGGEPNGQDITNAVGAALTELPSDTEPLIALLDRAKAMINNNETFSGPQLNILSAVERDLGRLDNALMFMLAKFNQEKSGTTGVKEETYQWLIKLNKELGNDADVLRLRQEGHEKFGDRIPLQDAPPAPLRHIAVPDLGTRSDWVKTVAAAKTRLKLPDLSREDRIETIKGARLDAHRLKDYPLFLAWMEELESLTGEDAPGYLHRSMGIAHAAVGNVAEAHDYNSRWYDTASHVSERDLKRLAAVAEEAGDYARAESYLEEFFEKLHDASILSKLHALGGLSRVASLANNRLETEKRVSAFVAYKEEVIADDHLSSARIHLDVAEHLLRVGNTTEADFHRQAAQTEDVLTLQAKLDELQTQCNSGDSVGCYMAGELYSDSILYRSEAFVTFQKGCMLGAWNACHREARSHRLGLGTPVNETLAQDLSLGACDAEFFDACAVAASYYVPLAGKKNLDVNRALELYTKACEADVAEACFGKAVIYHRGRHIDADLERATTLYDKACRLELDFACERLRYIKR